MVYKQHFTGDVHIFALFFRSVIRGRLVHGGNYVGIQGYIGNVRYYNKVFTPNQLLYLFYNPSITALAVPDGYIAAPVVTTNTYSTSSPTNWSVSSTGGVSYFAYAGNGINTYNTATLPSGITQYAIMQMYNSTLGTLTLTTSQNTRIFVASGLTYNLTFTLGIEIPLHHDMVIL